MKGRACTGVGVVGGCLGAAGVDAELDGALRGAGMRGADCCLAGKCISTAGGGDVEERDGRASGNERSGGSKY